MLELEVVSDTGVAGMAGVAGVAVDAVEAVGTGTAGEDDPTLGVEAATGGEAGGGATGDVVGGIKEPVEPEHTSRVAVTVT